MRPFLRDSVADAVQLDLEELEDQFDRAFVAADQPELMRIYGAIGELTRLNGGDGRPMIKQALKIARELGDERGIIANRIRLATAHFYQGEHVFAEIELRQVISDIEAGSDAAYLHYAWQLLGKCIAEQERYAEAIACFERALLLRDDPRLRASSQQAIDVARRRMLS